jgi:hypothetical protein
MPATFSVKCPECRTKLTSPRPIPGGKLLTCPKCDVMFAAPKPPPDDVVEDVEVIDDDVEVIDDVEVVESSKRKPKRAPSRAAVVDDVEVVDDDVEVVDEGVKKPRPKAAAFRKKSRNTKKVIGISVGVVCGLVVLGGGALLLFSFLGGGGEEPLGYLPSNSAMVGGANIQAILASPIGTTMGPVLSSPTMPFSKVMTATGNKPMNEAFDRVVFGGDQNGVTVVVKTMASIDRNKLAEAFGSSSSTSIGGQRVYRLGGGGPKAMFVPNKRIAVFSDASDNQLDSIARSSGSKTAVSSDLTTLAGKFNSSTIWAVVGPEMLKDPSFQTGFAAGLQSSPEGKAFAPVMQSARGAGVGIDFSSDLVLRFGVQCADEAAASAAVAQIQAASAKSRTDPSNKLMMLALPAWAKKISTEIADSMQASTDGTFAMVSMRVSMATVQEAISSAGALMPGATVPQGAGGMNRGGRR